VLQINKFVVFIAAQGVNEAALAIQRLNIFDNDEFDIMTQDQVDTSRIHKGKRLFLHVTFISLLIYFHTCII
jgi:hypothetical protein